MKAINRLFALMAVLMIMAGMAGNVYAAEMQPYYAGANNVRATIGSNSYTIIAQGVNDVASIEISAILYERNAISYNQVSDVSATETKTTVHCHKAIR